MTDTDIKQLEAVDNMLHRRILETPKTTPISILHLELGTTPIRHLIKSRRLMFLQYILKQDENTLVYKFLEAQLKNPQKGDWILQVKQDIEDVDLKMTLSEIKLMSEYSFHNRVRKAINKSAFNWLIAEKNKPRSNSTPKGSILNYEKFKIQDYFLPNTMTIKQCNLLFSLRSRMVPVRCNFKHSHNNLACPICQDQSQLDTQIHLLTCKALLKDENIIMKDKIFYSDIFSSDVKKQSEVTRCFDFLLRKRRNMENKNK